MCWDWTRTGQMWATHEKEIPRGLKPARDDKNKRLRRWPKGQLYLKTEAGFQVVP